MAAKSSKAYWAERAVAREQESFLRGAELLDALFRQYEHAAASVRREISDFYAKYAAKYGITYDNAVRLLTKSEMREWKYTLEEYQTQINATTDPKVKARLTAQLDALSTNSRITRLEALEGKIDLILNQVYDRGVREMKQEFGELFTEAYYKKHYDIQSRANIFAEIADISEETVENALSYPWSGAVFSDRLWKNKEMLLYSVRQILTQGCIQGKSIDAMTQALAAQMGQSYKAAERLIRTETSYFHNEASKKAYEAAEIEEYEFLASLSERTCEICGDMDHRHFPLKDATAGTNFPPMHPNCRCTTIAYDPDRELIYQTSGVAMPQEMTYAEWKAEQDALHSDGYVDKQRKKLYNEKADRDQYARYAERLGKNAPDSFEEFRRLKESGSDEWVNLQLKYRYKGIDDRLASSDPSFKVSRLEDGVPKVYAEQAEKLTDEQKKVIFRYTDGGMHCREINTYSATGNKLAATAQADAELLHQTLSEMSLPENVAVFRGTTVDRIRNLREIMDKDKVSDWKNQKVYIDAFASSSLFRDTAYKNEVELTILIPKGKKGAGYVNDISHHHLNGIGEEYEVTLQNHSCYTIREAQYFKGKLFLILLWEGI